MKVLALAALTLAVAVQSPSQLSGHNRDPVRSQVLTLPSSDFEASKIESRFREYLADSGSENRFLLIQAIDREESRPLTAIGFTDITYGLWKLLFSDYEKQIPPFAELLQINGNAGMRLRDYEGNVTMKVLKGQNPYEITGCGTSLSVLHVSLTVTRNMEKPGRTSPNLHFFFLSDAAVKQEITRCLLSKVQSLGLPGNISVSLRRGPLVHPGVRLSSSASLSSDGTSTLEG
jgi:hypothetical protein